MTQKKSTPLSGALIATQDEASRVAEMRAGERITLMRDITQLKRFGKITEFGPSTTRGYDWHFRDKRALWNDVHDKMLFDHCPYPVSTEVWCTETFLIDWEYGEGTRGQIPPMVYYKATDDGKTCYTPGYERWCSPAVMPQWASRSRLVVREVGVDGAQWKYEMEKV